MPNTSTTTRGYIVALLATLCLSTTAIFIRHLTLTYSIPALVLAFWRDVFVVLTLLVVLKLTRPGLLRIPRANLAYLVGYGLVVALFNSLWTLSVSLNGAAAATVLVYCSAAFTVLLGWRLLKEPLTGGKIAAVVLGLGGCVLVAEAYSSAAWSANLAGILTGVLSGLSYALYSLMGRSAAQRGLNPWTTLIYAFGFASVFLFFFNLLPAGTLPGAASRPADFWWLGTTWPGWLVLFALAAGPTVLGFGLYNVSLSLLASSVVNLIATLEPAFTALIAYFLLGERLGIIQLFGSALIVGGVIILRMSESRQPRFQEAEVVS